MAIRQLWQQLCCAGIVAILLSVSTLHGAEPNATPSRSKEQAVAHQIDLALFQAHDHSTPLPPIVDDEAFLRRVSLDLTGELPNLAEIRAFVADQSPQKRAKEIDLL